jgi:hypothetical protein
MTDQCGEGWAPLWPKQGKALILKGDRPVFYRETG